MFGWQNSCVTYTYYIILFGPQKDCVPDHLHSHPQFLPITECIHLFLVPFHTYPTLYPGRFQVLGLLRSSDLVQESATNGSMGLLGFLQY